MNGSKRKKSIPVIIAVMLVIAVIAYAGVSFFHARQAEQKADRVLELMKGLIPDLGIDSDISTGQGKDPLLILSIEDKSICGCLEIPCLDIMVPVTIEGEEEAGFVSVVSGSPVKGRFRLTGSRDDVFTKLASLKPGDVAAFTDVDGVRYKYTVTTQYHLKNWDEADNDLMLCYETDSDTDFVVGCTRVD